MRRRHAYGGNDIKRDEDESDISEREKSERHRLNEMYSFVNNDEVFDVRAGEVLVSSHTESGFPAHRRGALFSSLNGYKTQTEKDPEQALLDSDIRFIGLCQNDFVSSDTALMDQGMVCQVSGIKTIINGKLHMHFPFLFFTSFFISFF